LTHHGFGLILRTMSSALENLPPTLRDAIIYFADEDNAHAFMVAIRWPEGPQCPHCGTFAVTLLKTRRVFKCKTKGCRKQFTAKVGTIFEDSPISLGNWFTAMWLIVNCKNGISSYEIARDLKVCQKTAWFMLHRIREAMKAGSFDKKLCGVVEADETFVGGLFKNMHKSKREKLNPGGKKRGGINKAIVQAVLERDGEIRAQLIETTDLQPRLDFLKSNVDYESTLFTDAGYNYGDVRDSFVHDFVNHEIEYARGSVHCNGVENFWSLLKRGLRGTYISVEPFHLSAYVDEQAFRFNQRKDNDAGRFVKTLSQVTGRRLTYAELTRRDTVN